MDVLALRMQLWTPRALCSLRYVIIFPHCVPEMFVAHLRVDRGQLKPCALGMHAYVVAITDVPAS